MDVNDKEDRENGYRAASSPEAFDSTKGPPKVLVHLVDGLVIEESNRPFEEIRTPLVVNRGRARLRTMVPRARRARGGRNLGKDPTLVTVRCESCGRAGTVRSFLKSGRFCSITCSKRYRLKHGRANRRLRNVHPRSRYPRSKHPGSSPRKRLVMTSSRVSPYQAQSGEFTAESGVSQIVSRYHLPVSKVFDSPEISISIPRELISTNPSHWASQNVARFINAVGFNEYVQAFLDDDIDGESLLLLKLEHLVEVMRLPVGVAVKINSHIAKLFSVGSALT